MYIRFSIFKKKYQLKVKPTMIRYFNVHLHFLITVKKWKSKSKFLEFHCCAFGINSTQAYFWLDSKKNIMFYVKKNRKNKLKYVYVCFFFFVRSLVYRWLLFLETTKRKSTIKTTSRKFRKSKYLQQERNKICINFCHQGKCDAC